MIIKYYKVTSEAEPRYRGMLVYETPEGWYSATREAQLRRTGRMHMLHHACGTAITNYTFPYVRGKDV